MASTGSQCAYTALLEAFLDHCGRCDPHAAPETNDVVLYHRMLDMFGWQFVRYGTKKETYGLTYTYHYRITTANIPVVRRRNCLMSPTFAHNCEVFEFKTAEVGKPTAVQKLLHRALVAKLHHNKRYVLPRAQMDVEGSDGAINQVSSVAENTAITIDTALETSTERISQQDMIKTVSSTEQLHQFETILNRWIPLDRLTVTTSSRDLLAKYLLPDDLRKVACVANTLPFEQFIYGTYDIDFLLKPNANKFQAGRVMVSVIPAPVGLLSTYSTTWHQAVQRQHAFIDFAGTTAAQLTIPFDYYKTFVRNIEHGQNCAGVRGAIYARVEIWVISPLNVGSGQDADVHLLPFIRLRRAEFAAMSYRIPIGQGPVQQVVRRTAKDFISVIKDVEQMIDTPLALIGTDKPTVLTDSRLVVPMPRLSFTTGKGLSDASQMKLNPMTMTTMPLRCREQITINTLTDIASHWGYLATFTWSKNQVKDKILYTMPLEPTYFRDIVPKAQVVQSEIPPPISVVSRMVQYWTGTMQLRIEFVGTAFHTGAVTIGIEFGRQSATNDTCQTYSTYTTIFDMGETRVVEVNIPYIYDTPYRRTQTVPLFTHKALESADVINKYRTGILQYANSRLVVRVANQLKAPTTVTGSLACLVFVRAGQDWMPMGVIQNNGVFSYETDVDSFPGDQYQPDKGKDLRRSVEHMLEPHVPTKRSAHVGVPFGDTLIQPVTEISDECQLKLNNQQLFLDQANQRIAQLQREITTAQKKGSDDKEVQRVKQLQDQESFWNDFLSGPRLVKDTPTDKQQANRWLRQHPQDNLLPQDHYVWVEAIVDKWIAYQSPAYKHFKEQGWLTGKALSTRAQGPGDQTQKTTIPVNNQHVRNAHLALLSQSDDSIWDILRRPILIVSNYKVETSGGKKAFFLPLAPPNWACFSTTKTTPVYSTLARQSPQVAILSLFRYWRGCQRYIIVAKTADKPLYVMYLPKSGTRLIGMHEGYLIGQNDTPYGSIDLVSSGNAVEIIEPTINRTAHVEVPYITDLVWTLMHNTPKANFGWRDKADENVGHLVIVTTEDVEIDIFWAAGDDFRTAGFIGTPPQKPMRLIDTLHDNWPRAQMMDFHAEEECSQQNMLPVVKTTPRRQTWGEWVGEFKICKTWNRVHSIVERVDIIVPKLDTMVASGQVTFNSGLSLIKTIDDIPTLLAKTVKESVAQMIPAALSMALDCEKIILKLLLDIYVMWDKCSVKEIAVILTRWLIDLGVISIKNFKQVLQAMKDLFRYLWQPIGQMVPITNPILLFFKMLAHLFVVMIGYKTTFRAANKTEDWIVKTVLTGFASNLRVGLSAIETVLTFVQDVMSLLPRLWYYVVGSKDPEVQLYYSLVDQNQLIVQYIENIQEFSDDYKLQELTVDPELRLRYYSTLRLTELIERVLAKNPKLVVARSLISLIQAFKRKAEERKSTLSTAPVRFEPYVLCIEGESGIGKSYLTNAIATDLMQEINYKPLSELIYIRTPGKDFWDGYVDQPIIVFDDIYNINEPTSNVSVLADMYALKSSATFIPNMARLEDKDRKANPLVVIQCTNTPFPKLDESTCVEAVDRRRDLLVKAILQPDVEKDDRYNHLRFQFYKNPHRGFTGKGELDTVIYTYTEMVARLRAHWKEYYHKETQNVHYRTQKFYQSWNKKIDLRQALNQDPYMALTGHLYGVTIAQQPMSNTSSREAIQLAYERIWRKQGFLDELRAIQANLTSPDETVVGQGEDAIDYTDWYATKFASCVGDRTTIVSALQLAAREKALVPLFDDIDLHWSKCSACDKTDVLAAVECDVTHALCRECVSLKRRCPCDEPQLAPYNALRAVYYNLMRMLFYHADTYQVSISETFWVWTSFYYKEREIISNMLMITALDTILHILFDNWGVVVQQSLTHEIRQNEGRSWKEWKWLHGHDYFYIPGEDPQPIFRPLVFMDEVRQAVPLVPGREGCVHTLLTARPKDNATWPLLTTIRDDIYWLYDQQMWQCGNDLLDPFPCTDQACPLRGMAGVKFITQYLCERQQDQELMRTYFNEGQDHLLPPHLWSDKYRCFHYPRVGRMLYENITKQVTSYRKMNWWNWCKAKWNQKLASMIAITALTAAALQALIWWYKSATSTYKAVQELLGHKESEEEIITMEDVLGQGGLQGSGERNPRFRPRIARRGVKSKDTPKAQSASDHLLNVCALVYANIIQLQYTSLEGKVHTINFLGIRNHSALGPRHYLKMMCKWAQQGGSWRVINIQDPNRAWPYAWDIEDFAVDEINDLMVFQVPPQLGLFRNITKHFATREYWATQPLSRAGLLIQPPMRKCPLPIIHQLKLEERIERQGVLNPDGVGSFEIVDAIKYNYSMGGACGSPVLRYGGTHNLVGIHVAGVGEGVTGVGYGVIVTQEDLDELLPLEAQMEVIDMDVQPAAEAMIQMPEELLVHDIGAVEKHMIVRQPEKTKICQTLIAHRLGIEPSRVPMPLGANDGIYADLPTTPLMEGIKHHGEITADFPTTECKMIEEQLTMTFQRMEPLVTNPVVLTPQTAIRGMNTVPYYEPLPLNTSAGWPWCHFGKGSDKNGWLKVDYTTATPRVTIEPQLSTAISESIRLRQDAVVVNTVFADYLKDEKKKPTAALQPGKTRIFCMSPIDFTIVTRMYLFHFIAAFMANRFKLPHAVGINPDSFEWTEMLSVLKRRNNKHLFSIDFTNFGPGFSVRAAQVAMRCMKKWLVSKMTFHEDERDKFSNVVDCLTYELTNSKHLAMDYVYQQGAGSPSGAAVTVIINSMVHLFYLIHAYYHLVVLPRKRTIQVKDTNLQTIRNLAGVSHFFEEVGVIVYGDDGLVAPAPELEEIFNGQTVCQHLAKYGVVATDSTKTKEIRKLHTYEELEFLKRGVKPHPKYPNSYLAPLALGAVQDAAYYCWKGEDMAANTRENAAASILLMYGHGPEAFSEWRNTINGALVAEDLEIIQITWHELDELFFPVHGQAEVYRLKTTYNKYLGYFDVLLEDGTKPDNIHDLVALVEAKYMKGDCEDIPLLTHSRLRPKYAEDFILEPDWAKQQRKANTQRLKARRKAASTVQAQCNTKGLKGNKKK